MTNNYLAFFIYQFIILWTISINWHRWLLVNNHIFKYNSFTLVLYRRYINYVSVCLPTFWHLPTPLLYYMFFNCTFHLCFAPNSRYNVQSQPLTINNEGNVLFNDALNTFYLRLYGVGHMVKDQSDSKRGKPLLRLAARVLLYAPSHRQDSTYHSLCYASRGSLAGTRNSSMGGRRKDYRKRTTCINDPLHILYRYI